MDTVRSWKEPGVRLEAGAAPHPAGSSDIAELTDMDLATLDGASGPGTGLVGTFGCCWCVPWYSGWTVCGLVCSHPGC